MLLLSGSQGSSQNRKLIWLKYSLFQVKQIVFDSFKFSYSFKYYKHFGCVFLSKYIVSTYSNNTLFSEITDYFSVTFWVRSSILLLKSSILLE